MTQYTRIISRQITNAFPTWRSAMTNTDTLYYVTTNTPGDDSALTDIPTHFGASESGGLGSAGWDVMSGYSSGTLLEDVGGPFGTMVYGTGGHTRIQNQMLGCNLNNNNPTFYWWQQPTYKTSATGGAEIYYNPIEQTALEAGPRGVASIITTVGEDITNWDREFPVAFDGWIYPAKLITGQLGDNVPHGFRFTSIAYIPGSMTGSDSMMFAHLGPQGPFAQSWMPTGSVETDWVDSSALWDAGGTQRRRLPYYFKNLRTNTWTEHKWRPNIIPYTFGGIISGVFRDIKKIFSLGVAGTGGGSASFGYWSIDMSSGFGSHSVGSWTLPNGNEAGTSFSMGEYSCGAWTDGHRDGRHLALVPDANFLDGLIIVDFDSNTAARISLAGHGFILPSNSDYIGMSYDATENRVLILLKNSSTNALTYYSIGLPADPMVEAGYTVSLRNITTSEGGMPLANVSKFYGKTRIHPTLNCILVPCDYSRMMAFRPSS